MTGEQLKMAREAAGLTQLELANKVGLSLATISNYERGYPISTTAALKIGSKLPHVGGSHASKQVGTNAD